MTGLPLRVLFAASIVLLTIVEAQNYSLAQDTAAATGASGTEARTDSKPENSQSADAKNAFRAKLNQEFKLGGYSYKIIKAQFFSALNFKPSDSPHRQFKAPDGAMYVLIDYVMRYDGKQTVAAKPSSFKLVGSEGREYRPDDTILDVVRGSGRVIRSNHPGVSTQTYTVFLVPQNASPFRLTLRENPDEPNLKMATLDLQSNKPKPKQTSKRQTARRHNSDEITSEQRELWRRMDRPWGKPWRSFSAPDHDNYPNE